METRRSVPAVPAIAALSLLLVLGVLMAGGCRRGSQPAVQEFELQGHRGARGLHPENTRHGFRETLALGVTTLEMDIGVTKDGVAVVHHDESLNAAIARDPDGAWMEPPTPLVSALAWQEIQRFDVGRLKPWTLYESRFPLQQGRDGIAIPRLSDVLSEAESISGGRILYNVETKLTPDQPSWTLPPVEFAEVVVRELRAAGVERRAMIQSFDWRTLRHLEKNHPDIQTACLTTEQSGEDTIGRMQPGPSIWTAGLDVDDFDGSVPELVHAAGCSVWSPFRQDLHAADLASAHELGLRVIPWTVNAPHEIDAMLDLGVDGIISDYPDRVRAALAVRGLPLPASFGSSRERP
jgi:glycerophosphoryl diester phosphodiesterase